MLKKVYLLLFLILTYYTACIGQKKWYLSANTGYYYVNAFGGMDMRNYPWGYFALRKLSVFQQGILYESYRKNYSENNNFYLRNGLQISIHPTFFPPKANENLNTKAFVYLTNAFGINLFQNKIYAVDIGIDIQLLTNKFVMNNIVDSHVMKRIYTTPYLYLNPIRSMKRFSLGIKYDVLPFFVIKNPTYGNSTYFYTRIGSIKYTF